MGGFVGLGVPVILDRAIRTHGRNRRPRPGRAPRARRRPDPGSRAAGRALGLALPAALSWLAFGCCAPKIVRSMSRGSSSASTARNKRKTQKRRPKP